LKDEERNLLVGFIINMYLQNKFDLVINFHDIIFQTEEVANEMDETAKLNNFPNSLTTAPPQPERTTTKSIATTPRPVPIPIRPIGPPNLRKLFTGSLLGLPKNHGRYMGLGSRFFFVKPVGPRPTRTPVVA
jgi:hypothetical protein